MAGEVVVRRAPVGALGFLALAFAALGSAVPARAAPPPPAPVCEAPDALVRFSRPLSRFGQKLSGQKPLSIVAVGSSSTSGAGTSSPDHAYPNRLAAWLSKRFPDQPFTVENRGVPGAELEQMVVQLDEVLARGAPDLVVWQLGTNALLRHRPPRPLEARLTRQLQRLTDLGTDVVLVDPQFAPSVRDSPERDAWLAALQDAADVAQVDLFPRYQVMRGWADAHAPLAAFLAPDGLHMNDWGADCVARLLAQAIAEAARPARQGR